MPDHSKQMVCASVNLGLHGNIHFKASSVGEAKDSFKYYLEQQYGSLEGIIDRTGMDRRPCIDMYYIRSYDECECNSNETYHDYPSARWVIGNRGGISKVAV